jgi:putative PIN family toxin of toxin-antitoxin system
MRVLLDANILISYLLTPRQNSPVTKIVTQALLGDFGLLFPEDLLQELKGKAQEKKYLAERITPEELGQLVDILTRVSEPIPRIKEAIPAVTRDPKDDYLLAYALVGCADYLVTGDEDLLVLGNVGDLSIVSAREFVEILREQSR